MNIHDILRGTTTAISSATPAHTSDVVVAGLLLCDPPFKSKLVGFAPPESRCSALLNPPAPWAIALRYWLRPLGIQVLGILPNPPAPGRLLFDILSRPLFDSQYAIGAALTLTMCRGCKQTITRPLASPRMNIHGRICFPHARQRSLVRHSPTFTST